MNFCNSRQAPDFSASEVLHLQKRRVGWNPLSEKQESFLLTKEGFRTPVPVLSKSSGSLLELDETNTHNIYI